MTDDPDRRMLLQGLADQARGRMHAAEDAARQAAHSYAAGHGEAGQGFVADARAELVAASAVLARLEQMGGAA